MSWTAVTTTGRGELAFRLEIEGWPEAWVTHASMESLATDPLRYGGLKVSGQKLKAIANPVTNELDVSGFTCSVVDSQERASSAFRTWASARTWLTAELTSAATSMSVRSTDGFPSTGYLWVDSECIKYGGKSASPPQFTSLTRGAYSTLAQKHYVASIGRPRFPEVTNRPLSMAGRRAKLYAYGQLDDPQGNGTLIWQGVVTRHPSMQGGAWSISVDPITSILERTVAADLAEPTTPRGIYYTPAQPFRIRFLRRDTSGILTVSFPISSADRGFFESNADFCDYLTTKIEAAVAANWPGNEVQIVAVADGDVSWHMDVSSDGTVVELYEQPGSIDPVFPWLPSDSSGNEVGTDANPWTGDTVYQWRPRGGGVAGAGGVPRARFGLSDAATGLDPYFPPGRIYVGTGAALSSSISVVAIKWPGADALQYPEVTALSEASGYIEIAIDRPRGLFRPLPIPLWYTPASLPELRFGRTWTASGSVWTAIQAISAAAPDGLNAGSIPDIRTADFDSAAWGALDETWQPRIVRSRMFTSFSEATLLDMIRGELTAAGYFLGISDTGTITIAQLRPLVSGGTAATVLTSRSVPSYEVDAFGHVSVLRMKRGYDPIEDDYTLSDVVVWDIGALGRNPAARALTIEPRSVPSSGVAETWAEVVETTARLFAVLAQPYARIQLGVPLSMFSSSVVGSVVSVTTELLPDAFTGTRGVSALACLVTGREIDLSRGEIGLKLLTVVSNAAGYAPQALVTAETNISGNTWDLTLQASGYVPTGDDATDHWASGDEVVISQWDSTSTAQVAGVVDSVTGNVVRVTFDASAAAITSGDWFLSYAPASTFVQASQESVMFLADSDGIIDFSTGDPAKAFA